MIGSIIFYFVPSLISLIGILYISNKFLNIDINLFKIRTIAAIIGFIILNILIYVNIDGFLRMVVNTLIIIVTIKLLYKVVLTEAVSTAVLIEVLNFISELIITIILILLQINIESLNTDVTTFIFINFIITFIALMEYNIPFINKFINRIMDFFFNVDGVKKYLLIFIFFVTLNVLLVSLYFWDNKYITIINLLFIIVYSSIMYFFINEKNKNIEFKQQNDALVSSLFEYEKMLDYQRVNNHENKNQLLVIKDMIRKTNKKALEYIDTIIDEKRKDDEGLYAYAKIIPAGGLQGLIYQKMLEMKEKHINIELNVDKEVRKVNLDHISNRTKYDLYRAVGIIIDNAIDETLKLKEKSIMIIMYKEDNNIVIEVSNRCKDIPDLSKIDEKGYTTKSTGHGYGLSLLKSITNNDCISNIRSINKDIFTQIIKVKIN